MKDLGDVSSCVRPTNQDKLHKCSLSEWIPTARLTDYDFHRVMNTETLSVDIQPKIHSILSDVTLEADSRLSGQLTNTVPTACKFLKSCFRICCGRVGSSWF